MHPKDDDGMANSVDPDQTASEEEAVWSWSALFAETYLSQYIEFVRYHGDRRLIMKGCEQWNFVDTWNIFASSWDQTWTARSASKCLTRWDNAAPQFTEARKHIQSTHVISTWIISSNSLSRRENLIPVFT